MSASLAILSLAAFALVAVLASALVHVSLPWLDALSARIAPRTRVRLWLSLCSLPSAFGFLALSASFLPAIGIGHDHCMAHSPHHPHLCPHHTGGAPGFALVVIAIFLAVRVMHVVVQLASGVRSSRDISGTLAEASDTHEGVLLFPSEVPQAFVVGFLRPRVHASRGLLPLGRAIVDAVLAHERVHARRRDLMWRALCPVLAMGHLPSATRALRTRLISAQEMAADAEAAEALPAGRLKIAEALIVLAKLARTPSPGISFVHGNVEDRVRALLEGPRIGSAWPARLLLGGGLLMPVIVGALHDAIHHGLETLLGTLS